jgi:hypothetical protein
VEDRQVLGRINELIEEEHRLRGRHQQDGLSDEERDRLRALEVDLDQCWDLLRQRRAAREAGQDPDLAHPRPGQTVEGYLQ